MVMSSRFRLYRSSRIGAAGLVGSTLRPLAGETFAIADFLPAAKAASEKNEVRIEEFRQKKRLLNPETKFAQNLTLSRVEPTPSSHCALHHLEAAFQNSRRLRHLPHSRRSGRIPFQSGKGQDSPDVRRHFWHSQPRPRMAGLEKLAVYRIGGSWNGRLSRDRLPLAVDSQLDGLCWRPARKARRCDPHYLHAGGHSRPPCPADPPEVPAEPTRLRPIAPAAGSERLSLSKKRPNSDRLRFLPKAHRPDYATRAATTK